MSDWDQTEHPRDPDDGRFVEKRGGERWIQRLSEQIEPAIRYYHGTTIEGLEEILPISRHGGVSIYPFTGDRDYAYATDEAGAWHYAEGAWAAMAGGIPHVYEVEPIDPDDVEVDPFYDEMGRSRSTRDQDVRSRAGWRVLRELPWPEAWGDPEDWR